MKWGERSGWPCFNVCIVADLMKLSVKLPILKKNLLSRIGWVWLGVRWECSRQSAWKGMEWSVLFLVEGCRNGPYPRAVRAASFLSFRKPSCICSSKRKFCISQSKFHRGSTERAASCRATDNFPTRSTNRGWLCSYILWRSRRMMCLSVVEEYRHTGAFQVLL